MDETKLFETIEKAVWQATFICNKTVLTIDEVAKYTGLSKCHIYRLTSEKRIPHYKPSNKLLFFNKSEIETWMQQNRVDTIEESEQMAAAYNIKHNH